MISILRQYIRNYRFNLWLLEGTERSSGQPLKIVYAGHRANKNYISYLAYDGPVKEKELGIIWLWTVLQLNIKYQDSHLVIVEIDRNIYKHFASHQGVYIPCWINGELDMVEVHSRMKTSENIRSDLRRIRKNKLDYEVTHDSKLFDHFYYDMYKPHITRVHQDRALLMSHQAMIDKMDQCDLLLVKKDGEYLAGELLIYEHGTVRAWSIGIKDGDSRYLKYGAVGALYYFRTQYLEEKGYKSINMGASRAFLNDGVLQYKKKWGMRLTGPRTSGFWMRLNTIDEGVYGFLANNPFIIESGGSLEGALFLLTGPEITGNLISKSYKSNYMPGMSLLNIYTLLGKDNKISLPSELNGSIAVNPVDHIF